MSITLEEHLPLLELYVERWNDIHKNFCRYALELSEPMPEKDPLHVQCEIALANLRLGNHVPSYLTRGLRLL